MHELLYLLDPRHWPYIFSTFCALISAFMVTMRKAPYLHLGPLGSPHHNALLPPRDPRPWILVQGLGRLAY